MPKKSKHTNQSSIIIPEAPGTHQHGIFQHFLTQTNDKIYLKSSLDTPVIYSFTTKQTKSSCFRQSTLTTTHSVQFSSTLIKYRRRKNPTTHRWAVLGTMLGAGGQGAVFEVIATLYVRGNELIIKDKYTRIAKLMAPKMLSLNSNTERNTADHEFTIMNILSDIYHPHLPLHDKKLNLDVLISKRFAGYALDHLLDKTTIISNMTLHKKIRLCKWLLLELQKLHQADITHRDIKPDNIMIELNNKNIVIAVKIIDLGCAKENSLDTSSVTQPGTLSYMAPETFQQTTNPTVDIFAMGRIFWQIFCDLEQTTSFIHSNNIVYYTYNNIIPSKEDFFQHSTLSRDIQSLLYQLFLDMGRPNPDDRASINDCLKQLDHIAASAATPTSIKGTASSDGLFRSRPITPSTTNVDEEKGKEKLTPVISTAPTP